MRVNDLLGVVLLTQRPELFVVVVDRKLYGILYHYYLDIVRPGRILGDIWGCRMEQTSLTLLRLIV